MSADLLTHLSVRLVTVIPAGGAVCVGLSGGMDSVVLLHLLSQLAPRHGWRVSALHVHHGISPNAAAWADFCAGLCERLGVPLAVERVDIAPLRHLGIEAAARTLRHAALARQFAEFIALAHHADDQAETLLLQLLRGAGLKGAAAMSELKAGDSGPALLRPLLGCTRRELLDYATAHDLSWIEDESNADTGYPRNFLRHHILPRLERHYPACRETLARSAAHFAEADALLTELAQQDAGGAWGETLAVERLAVLSRPRAANLLRQFLHARGAPLPQAAQLDQMLTQLASPRANAEVCVEFGGWQVRRYQGAAYVLPRPAPFDPALVLDWQESASLHWPPLARDIHFRPLSGQGISLDKLRTARVTLRLRQGGESLRPHPRAATRTLKNLLQQHQIPPWQRARLPLLYCGEQLVSVIGVAVAAEWQASAGEAGLGVG
ncbi:tRNA lysidine(34) synthetase TilS [Ferriphaselus sp. R-1]|uniref:tRNA lysidine(34) synthetase TilS n=1 Tax=Ferriphaselus sp. R-1 TaxID=1485544 RepID=UPI0005596F4E|nr:tRNA lysidine(34) synthetase TilS [Ferriphaselus sp. R-1]